MQRASHWSDSERKQIAALIMAGRTCKQIAKAVGLNRNQVIGRLYRDKELHQLVGKNYTVAKMESRKPAKPKVPPVPPLHVKPVKSAVADCIFGAGKSLRHDKIGSSAPTFPPPVRLAPRMLLVPLLDVGRCQCRFPVETSASTIGGYLFCAAPAAPDQVYCDHHRAIVTPGGRHG